MKRLHPFRIVLVILFIFGLCKIQADAQDPAAISNHIPAGYTGKSVTGAPQPIPGKIEVESYDITTGNPQGMTMGYGSPKKLI